MKLKMPMSYFKNPIVLLAVAFIVYMSFGLYHLTKFETCDEHLWMYNPDTGRIDAYWQGMLNEKRSLLWTRINDKPGITVALVSGIGLWIEPNPKERLVEEGSVYEIVDPQKTERMNFAFRFPILLFNGLFSLFFFWILRKITGNKWLALWSSILILLSPVLLGISQIVNPDSLLWTFSSALFFSFFAYLKTGQKKFVLLASLFLGLSLLSKYTAVILFPFLFAMLVAYIFFEYSLDDESFSKRVVRFTIAYPAIIVGSLALFAILMPAVFIKPKYLFDGTIGYGGMFPIFIACLVLDALIFADAYFWKSRGVGYFFYRLEKLKIVLPKLIAFFFISVFVFVLLNWMGKKGLVPELRGIEFDERQSPVFNNLAYWKKMIMENYSLVFSLTPLALFALLFVWLRLVFVRTKQALLIFLVSLFMLAYFFALIDQNLLTTVRYNIMLYPLVMVMSAIGIWQFFQIGKLKNFSKVGITLLIILISSLSLWFSKPFYFNYTNNLLPKDRLITDAWGYGNYEAAQYLNSLPNAENSTAWSDYYGFCSFFKGRCILKGNLEKFNSKSTIEDKTVTYFVKTRRGLINNPGMWIDIAPLVEKNPIWEMTIDGRPENYIKIYKAL